MFLINIENLKKLIYIYIYIYIDVVMPMYNLIECDDNCSET